MTTGPLKINPLVMDANSNVRVTITNVVDKLPAVVGYANEYPVREPMARHVLNTFMDCHHLIIYGAQGEVIHVGPEVISRSLIQCTVIEVNDERAYLFAPEPRILPVLS